MVHNDPPAPATLDQVQPTRWPLALAASVDLAVVLGLIVFMSVLVFIYVYARAIALGLVTLNDPNSARQLTTQTINQLLGVGGTFVILLVQNVFFIAVPILRIVVLRREPLATLGFRAPAPWRLIGIGLGIGVLILISNAALGYLFNTNGIEQNQADQYPLFQGDYLGQALFLVAGAVFAPIGEEVLFRGYLFNAIHQTFQSKRWGLPLAYLVSALIFMAAHSLSATQGLVGLLIPTFLMGLVLAWVMHYTGSLLPCIVAHALNNGVALTIMIIVINNPNLLPSP